MTAKRSKSSVHEVKSWPAKAAPLVFRPCGGRRATITSCSRAWASGFDHAATTIRLISSVDGATHMRVGADGGHVNASAQPVGVVRRASRVRRDRSRQRLSRPHLSRTVRGRCLLGILCVAHTSPLTTDVSPRLFAASSPAPFCSHETLPCVLHRFTYFAGWFMLITAVRCVGCASGVKIEDSDGDGIPDFN